MRSTSTNSPTATRAEDASTSGTDGRQNDRATPEQYSRRRVLASSAVALGTVGVVGSTTATAEDAPNVDVSVNFADSTVDGGDTTRLEMRLSEVPETGLTGWTFLVELVGSGTAEFTGEGEFNDDLALSGMDTENTDSDSVAYINGANAGSVEAGDTDLLICDVEIYAAAEGEVSTDIDVQELSDANVDPIDADIGSASLTIEGDATGGGLPGQSDDSSTDAVDDGEVDDVGGSDDGTDVDPGPDDDASNDGSDDAADADDREADDDDADDGGDPMPGFGAVAAIGALLTGAAARYATRSGADDPELSTE